LENTECPVLTAATRSSEIQKMLDRVFEPHSRPLQIWTMAGLATTTPDCQWFLTELTKPREIRGYYTYWRSYFLDA
jgi:hypothetical protein